MKKLFVIILLTISFQLPAQHLQNVSANNKWELSAYYYPTIFSDIGCRCGFEGGTFIGFGGDVSLYIAKRFAVSSGINYRHYNYEFEENFNRSTWFEIPVNIKYNFVNRDRMQLYVTNGLSNIVYFGEVYMEWEGIGPGDNEPTHQFYSVYLATYNFGLGSLVSVSPKLKIRFEPGLGIVFHGAEYVVNRFLKLGIAYNL